jgi:uncharacterized protein YukE
VVLGMAKDLDSKINYIQEKLDDVAGTIHKIDKDVALQKAAFEEHQKQDEGMYEELKRMNDILQLNTESLKEHMHRTELLEKAVNILDTRLSPIEHEKIQKKAIEDYRKEKIIEIAKILGLITAALGVITAIQQLM